MRINESVDEVERGFRALANDYWNEFAFPVSFIVFMNLGEPKRPQQQMQDEALVVE